MDRDYLRLLRGGRKGYFTHVYPKNEEPIGWADNILERLKEIDAHYSSKSKRALYKALIRKVPQRLLPALLEAKRNLDDAREEKKEAEKTYINAPWELKYRALDVLLNAKKAFSDAYKALDREIVAIHSKVCHPNCPWTPENHDIFARGESLDVLGSHGVTS